MTARTSGSTCPAWGSRRAHARAASGSAPTAASTTDLTTRRATSSARTRTRSSLRVSGALQWLVAHACEGSGICGGRASPLLACGLHCPVRDGRPIFLLLLPQRSHHSLACPLPASTSSCFAGKLPHFMQQSYNRRGSGFGGGAAAVGAKRPATAIRSSAIPAGASAGGYGAARGGAAGGGAARR
jgi:hypothetical protein